MPIVGNSTAMPNLSEHSSEMRNSADSIPASDVIPAIHASEIDVLLIDDDRCSLIVVGKLLASLGHTVTTLSSGEEAKDVIMRFPNKYDLVMCDLNMPGLSGLDILKLVRSQPDLHHISVVMLSSHHNSGAIFESIRRGADDYILKPAHRNSLKLLWQHVWRRRYSWKKKNADGEKQDVIVEGSTRRKRERYTERAWNELSDDEGDEDDEEDSEMYTAEELRAHCLRQIEMYSKLVNLIDTQSQFFPQTSETTAPAGMQVARPDLPPQ